ncbi:MAG: hypothetical protein QXP01_03140 [Candidatus Hadarchaeum sp.]
MILDPRKMNGHAPAPPAYTPVNIPAGQEKFYILLPQTDVLKASNTKRNSVQAVRMTGDRLLEVHVLEIPVGDPPLPGLYYYFDSSLRCVRVDADDYFVKVYSKLEEQGKVRSRLDERYYEELRDGVRYWDGEKFVKKPTMNKRYMAAMRKLP